MTYIRVLESDRQRSRPILMIEGMSDPEELEAAQRRRELFDRNAAWLEAHGDEVFERYRGQCICVSEGDVFAAESALSAVGMAKAVHPEDDGRFVYQVPSERANRIYANRW